MDRVYAVNLTQTIAYVVLAGLQVVIPLISEDLLQFSQIRTNFFKLIAFMVELYPEKVAEMPMDQFQTLMTALGFGISFHDSDIALSSLQAVSELALYHYRESFLNGKRGLGNYLEVEVDGDKDGFLINFLKMIMSMLFFEEFKSGLMRQLSDTFVSVLFAEVLTFSNGEKGWDCERIAELVSNDIGDNQRERLIDCLREVLEQEDADPTTNITATRFGALYKHVRGMVCEARSFLRKH
eukprot:TRINITY_DN7174_c0_g1_i2.p1 TRINITY_DN7174_c0_g1~~TRINITY_DN7174_c0_g1_i2.p1  ORF type:complete len:239 (-),score=87.30 TRINITY_DN7174_c0_g1_i2:39-755(-)